MPVPGIKTMKTNPDMLKTKDVMVMTGLSHFSVTKLIKESDFPKPFFLTPKVRRWSRRAVLTWLHEKMESEPQPEQEQVVQQATPELASPVDDDNDQDDQDDNDQDDQDDNDQDDQDDNDQDDEDDEVKEELIQDEIALRWEDVEKELWDNIMDLPGVEEHFEEAYNQLVEEVREEAKEW